MRSSAFEYVLDREAFDVTDRFEPSLPWNTSEAEKRSVKVLRLLARSGVALNKYSILRQLPKAGSKPTILKVVDDLKSRRYIKVESDPRAKGFRGRSEHYKLSWLGLAKVISTLEDEKGDYKLLRDLAAEYRNVMRPVFDLWPAIVQAGIERTMAKNLAYLCYEIIVGVEGLLREPWGFMTLDGRDSWSPPTEEQEYAWFRNHVQKVGVHRLLIGKPIFRHMTETERLSVDIGFDTSSFDKGEARSYLEAVRRNRMLREAMLSKLRDVAQNYRDTAMVYHRNATAANNLATVISMPEDLTTNEEIRQWVESLPEDQWTSFRELLGKPPERKE